MNVSEGPTVPLDAWLERVRAHVGGAPALDEAERDAILGLTRLAAHTSERIAGPLTVYLLGMAVAGEDPGRRVARIAELAARMSAEG